MKMTMRNLVAATVLAVSSLTTSIATVAEPVVLRYNQWFPSQHWSQKDGLYKYFEEIEQVTDGRVKVQPSAKPIAPPNRNYQSVASGIVDLAWGPHGYTPGVFPLSEMVEFPFSVNDAGISSVAYQRVFDKYFKPAGMHNEVVTLAVHVTSGGNIHMKDKPINTVEDLKGTKIRVQTAVVGEALKSLGGVPVNGSLAELREFLSRGIVDGTTLSDELLTGFKVDSYINYVTQIPGGLYSNSAFVIVNKDTWAKISKQDQDAIMAISGEKLAKRMGDLWHKNDLLARDQLKQRLGDHYQMASEELFVGIDDAFMPIRTEWLEKAKAAGVDGQEAMRFYQDQTEAVEKSLVAN
jgi:TRAP-type C4-dicarboxylate transport system substrate-binding protein